MNNKRELVLVADDDEDILRFVEVNLRLEGYEVATASDGEQALENAYELVPDLALLDVMMPKIDGFEVCRRMRADGDDRPVIFLTARDTNEDKISGFTKGGDDYLTKPFSLEELLARVRAALRRRQPQAREVLRVGDLTLHTAAREVMRGS
nr:response regulator [Actinomycetota bacterium]